MAGSGSESLHGGLSTWSRAMENSKAGLMTECLRKRAELMENARNQSLASADCQFEWTLSGTAKKIPGAKDLMEYGTKPHQIAQWDTLDLGTLSRAIDKGHVQVRAWDEYPRSNVDRSRSTYQKRLDFCTQCMRLVDLKLGTPLSWDASGSETAGLLNSFSKPFELKLRDQCLHWQFTPDYPAFPSTKGGFKNWSDQEVQECDDAMKSGQFWLIACSSDIQSTSTARHESSGPAASVPRDRNSAETIDISRGNNAGPSYPTSRHQTPILAQPVLAHTQSYVAPTGGYPGSEKSQSTPPADLLSRLNKQSEEISTLQNQLKRVQTQAANSHSKIQALQLELDVAKSGLKQSESDVVLLRTEVQDMKDFINKRSTVTCNLEFLTENLKERLEQLESQANSASQGLAHHTPEPTESLPEVVPAAPEAVPTVKSEIAVSAISPVATPFTHSTLVTDSTPIEPVEDVRRSHSTEATTSVYESVPDEAEVGSEPGNESSNRTTSDPEQNPTSRSKKAAGRINNSGNVIRPSRQACLKELGMSPTIKEGEYTTKISLMSTIYENWGGFPSKILPQKMLPALGRHQHVLRKLANLSTKVPRAVAIRLLQESISHDKSSPNREVITKRDLDNALAQALENDRRPSSIPHQGQNGAMPASLGNISDIADGHTSSESKTRGMSATKKRHLSGESGSSSPRKRLKSNIESNVDVDLTSS